MKESNLIVAYRRKIKESGQMNELIMKSNAQEIIQEKKKNKGFSLVELIVVIAILAILAVVIAPQVIRYIGQSRTSTDASNSSLYETAASTALADEDVYNEVANLTDDLVITCNGAATGPTYSVAVPHFEAEFESILNENYPVPATPGDTRFVITIDVDTTAHETRTITVAQN